MYAVIGCAVVFLALVGTVAALARRAGRRSAELSAAKKDKEKSDAIAKAAVGAPRDAHAVADSLRDGTF